MNAPRDTLPDVERAGVAPADARRHARWPAWRAGLAYVLLFLLALGSILVIDDHVLRATPDAATTTSIR